MNEPELYHYGVKGMKWGVRRAKKQLSRLSGRKRSDITDQEAEDFRQDVKYAKKHKGLNVGIDPNTRTVNYHDYKNREIGREYAAMIMDQTIKDREVRALVGTYTVGIGLSAAAAILGKSK
jgi:hypothetical protein